MIPNSAINPLIDRLVPSTSTSRLQGNGAPEERAGWTRTTDRRGADGVVAGAGEAVGEDDLVPGVLLAYPGLGVGEVPAIAEPHPGRRHGRPLLAPQLSTGALSSSSIATDGGLGWADALLSRTDGRLSWVG
jgi:hypothetical protein